MKLRRANSGDSRKLSLLGGATFLETFADDHYGDDLVDFVATAHSVAFYAGVLDDPGHALWLVEHDVGAPIGYAMMLPASLPGTDPACDIELKRIYMLSRWHGTGFGSRLIEVVETEAKARGAKRLVLAVYKANVKAQHFYAARGFEIVGETVFADFDASMSDYVMAKILT